MKLARYLAAILLFAVSALANSTYLSTTPNTRAGLSALKAAEAALGTYQHVYVSEGGFQAVYDWTPSASQTCGSASFIAADNSYICPSDASPPATGRWVRGLSLLGGSWDATYTGTTAVAAPTLAAGIFPNTFSTSTGSVAAGTYACKVTYVGATGGETTASPTSGTVTVGANATLYCQPNDAPAGASGFNSYWQTGGTGNFYRGHTNTPFVNNSDIQTTTPPTSGAQPPSTNTATGALAGLQNSLAGGTGLVGIAASTPISYGNPGDMLAGQTALDGRTGAIISHQTYGAPQSEVTGSVQDNGLYVAMTPPQLINGQQVNAIRGVTNQGCGNGLNLGDVPAIAAGFFSTYRCGSIRAYQWALNSYAYFDNQLGPSYAAEFIMNNASGSPAPDAIGLHLLGVGSRMADGATISGAYNVGMLLAPDPGTSIYGLLVGAGLDPGILNYSGLTLASNTAAISTLNQPSKEIKFVSSLWDSTHSAYSDIFTLAPTPPTSGNAYNVLTLSHTGYSTYNVFQTQGIHTILQGFASTDTANPILRLTPGANDTNVALQVTNAANSAQIAYINNSGYAGFQGLSIGTTPGVTCSGTPSASFASLNGLITHC